MVGILKKTYKSQPTRFKQTLINASLNLCLTALPQTTKIVSTTLAVLTSVGAVSINPCRKVKLPSQISGGVFNFGDLNLPGSANNFSSNISSACSDEIRLILNNL